MPAPLRSLTFALATLAMAPATAAQPSGVPAPAPRPHVVLVLADDLGYSDLGCQGSSYYLTPHLDALAADGLRFTQGYANAPNCAPTRACLMSGQDTPRHGIYTVSSGDRGRAEHRSSRAAPNRTVLDPEFLTLAEALRARGYRTAHLGKWHLGEPGEAGPLEQGFDVQVAGNHSGHPPSYFSPYRNPQLEDGPAGEYLTDRLTDEAIAIVEDFTAASRSDGRPFFLYLPHYAVHTPIQARDDDAAVFVDREPDGGQADPRYAGMVRALDRGVGRILACLDRLGIRDDTMVVFTSDNGGLGGYAGLETRGVTDNRPLRGGKGMLYEGGIRVPWIVRWPGVTEPGTTSDAPVLTYDLYPTLLAAAGGTGPRPDVLDGRDITPALRGEPLPTRDLVWHFPGYLQANSKLGTWRTTPRAAIRRGGLKLLEDLETGSCELYDLVADPGEAADLAAARRGDVLTLRSALQAWRADRAALLPQPRDE